MYADKLTLHFTHESFKKRKSKAPYYFDQFEERFQFISGLALSDQFL
jgi:hypothetical protein